MEIGVALGSLGLAMGGPVEPAALVYARGDSAERLGFAAVWARDHLALPRRPTTPYPYGDGGLLSANTSLLDLFAVLVALADPIGIRSRVIGLLRCGPQSASARGFRLLRASACSRLRRERESFRSCWQRSQAR